MFRHVVLHVIVCVTLAGLPFPAIVVAADYDAPDPTVISLERLAASPELSRTAETRLILEIRSRATDRHLSLLQKRLQLQPERADLLGQLAWLHYERFEFAEALAAAERTRKLDPAEPWALLVSALIHQQNYRPFPALEAYERLLSTDLSVFRDSYVSADVVRISMAHAWCLAREPQKARQLLDEVRPAVLASADLLALRLLEQVYLRLGDPVAAENLYRDILRADNENPNARLQLARLHLAAGRIDDALERLQKLCSEYPELLQPGFYRFQALMMQGSVDRAAQELRRLTTLDWRSQAREEILGRSRFAPYPDCKVLFGYVCLAAGRWAEYGEVQRQLLKESLEVNTLPIPKEEFFTVMIDEDCLEFQLATSGENYSDWGRRLLEPVEEFMQPTKKKARPLFAETARLLRQRKAAEALVRAEEGLKIDPDCIGLAAQAMMAAYKLRDYPKIYQYFEQIRAQVSRRKIPELSEHLAHLPALLEIYLDRIRRQWLQTGNWLGRPVEGQYEEQYQAMDRLREESDSLLEKSLISVAMFMFSFRHFRMDRIAADYARYLDLDPDLNLQRYVYARFGAYFGI